MRRYIPQTIFIRIVLFWPWLMLEWALLLAPSPSLAHLRAFTIGGVVQSLRLVAFGHGMRWCMRTLTPYQRESKDPPNPCLVEHLEWYREDMLAHSVFLVAYDLSAVRPYSPFSMSPWHLSSEFAGCSPSVHGRRYRPTVCVRWYPSRCCRRSEGPRGGM